MYLVKHFLKIVLVSTIIIGITLYLGGYIYINLTQGNETGPSNIFYSEDNIETDEDLEKKDDKTFLKVSKKTNFLILGVDQEEYLSDVIILGSFDRDSQIIDLISIPRDTYTEFSTEELAKLRTVGISPGKIVKYNAVHSYGVKDFGIEFVVNHIEETFGVHIDYYLKVNTKGFREIVDAAGGVDFDVPMDMVYSDPLQNLYINVPKGRRILTGKEAEGVVRFRSDYVSGDLQRVKVQQELMKALFNQILTFDTIIKNPLEFFKIIKDNTETNFKLSEIPKYLEYIPKLSADKLITHTMPFDETKLTSTSYIVPDRNALTQLINEIFYQDRLNAKENEEDIFKKKIEILNGARIAGVAGKTEKTLNELGFNVVKIGTVNKNDGYSKETIIRVKPGINVEKLEKLFENPKIEYVLKITDLYDIKIIIGLNGDMAKEIN